MLTENHWSDCAKKNLAQSRFRDFVAIASYLSRRCARWFFFLIFNASFHGKLLHNRPMFFVTFLLYSFDGYFRGNVVIRHARSLKTRIPLSKIVDVAVVSVRGIPRLFRGAGCFRSVTVSGYFPDGIVEIHISRDAFIIFHKSRKCGARGAKSQVRARNDDRDDDDDDVFSRVLRVDDCGNSSFGNFDELLFFLFRVSEKKNMRYR